MFRFPTLIIFALAATFVAAQSPETCIITCALTAAAAAGCTSYTDFFCACTSQRFQEVAGSCIAQTCPDQLANALAFQQEACRGIVPSGTPSLPSTSAPAPSETPSASNTWSLSGGTRAPVSTPHGAAFKNAPVAGAMGALPALVGAAIF